MSIFKEWSKDKAVFTSNVSFNIRFDACVEALKECVDFHYTIPVAGLHSKILDAPPPPGIQILSNSCSFWKILAKSYVGARPGELAPPSRGNPGSATAFTFSISISTIASVKIQMDSGPIQTFDANVNLHACSEHSLTSGAFCVFRYFMGLNDSLHPQCKQEQTRNSAGLDGI